ncbi:MAG: sulfotransferase domain-containing protein [Candidatus Babeliales bacterium]|nr:sulfotransferase domain-containing protein [Candidatus Babeliales bacterium]
MKTFRLIIILFSIFNYQITLSNWSVDFLIIGAAKCGTTSLYNYLIQHPDILPAAQKEVHYFDLNYERGLDWYKSHFLEKSPGKITGEASPFYLYHPLVPERVFKLLPKTKLIVLLRDPVERAISDYFYTYPGMSFEEALQKEVEIIKQELDKINNDQYYDIYSIIKYSYLTRGIYIDQIKRWREYFPKEQMLFLIYDDLCNDPKGTVNKVFKFLGLPELTLKKYDIFNKTFKKEEIKPETKHNLYQFFAEHNKQLEEYLGIKLPWKN